MSSIALRSAEIKRLAAENRREPGGNWKRWGTYLTERQWGTVREDYSLDGEPWTHFTHDDAVWRGYRWGEDGILGWTDRQNRFCFAITLWNGGSHSQGTSLWTERTRREPRGRREGVLLLP